MRERLVYGVTLAYELSICCISLQAHTPFIILPSE